MFENIVKFAKSFEKIFVLTEKSVDLRMYSGGLFISLFWKIKFFDIPSFALRQC